MGSNFYVNADGSITNSEKKVIDNIDWIDYNQIEDKHTGGQKSAKKFFISPIGWPFAILFFPIARMVKGYWPYLGIKAIENTTDTVQIYCNKKGKLGLYANKRRLTKAIFDSVQPLPTPDYPVFILEHKNRYSLYNYTQKKMLFKNSNSITYIGTNMVEVYSRYSIIGMNV